MGRDDLEKLTMLKEEDDKDFHSRFSNDFTVNAILGVRKEKCLFKVRNLLDNWKYAVKRIQLVPSENYGNQILREFGRMAMLDHPNIVRHHSSWIEQPPPGWQIDEELKNLRIQSSLKLLNMDSGAFLYIQMELCNYSLEDWLEWNQLLSSRLLSRMKLWFTQIVTAVSYLHDLNVIHRNLMPSNILFVQEDRLKVSDFGLVKNIEDEAQTTQARSMKISVERCESYRSPEQNSFFSMYSSKVDVFALGLILAEMCTVISEEDACEVFDNYRFGKPNTVLEDLPEVEEFVALMTNVDPEKRISCREALQHPFMKERIEETIRHKKRKNDDEEVPEFESEFMKKFKPRKMLGVGGFGVVFEATSIMDGSDYAVKRIPVSARDTERVLKEVRLMASLHHDAIVGFNSSWIETPPESWQLFNDEHILRKIDCENDMARKIHYGPNCSFIYIQMELCKCSLAEWLQNNEQRIVAQSKEMFRQIVSGVGYIHEHKLIHRNLKPRAILVDAKDRLKIGSFGIITEQHIVDGCETDGEHSATGTPLYMSPEQSYFFMEYSSKTDIFSLGLILTELLVVLSYDERSEVGRTVTSFLYLLTFPAFENFRRGQPNQLFDDPQVAQFVALLTDVDSSKRPTCKQILDHQFLATDV